MQILEQLVMDSKSVTSVELMCECSSVLGFLECMDDCTFSDVLESSIVMEGFDPKAILKKIWGFIKSIFTKIGQMINKLIGFVRGRKGKLKKKEVADAGGNNSNDGDGKDFPEDEGKGGRSSSSTVARIGMKSKDELIEEVLKKHPYSGVHPNAIQDSLRSVSNFSSFTLSNAVELSAESITLVDRISRSDIPKNYTQGKMEDDLADELERILRMQKKGTQHILSRIADAKDNGWELLKGKIKSPQDFKNVPLLIYGHYRKDSNVSDYSNEIFYEDEFEEFVEGYNDVVGKHLPFYLKTISDILMVRKNDVDKYIKKCDEMSKQLDKIPNVDQEVLTNGFSAVTNLLNITSQCISYTIMGVPAFFAQVESDLGQLGAYIDTVNAELNAIK